MASKLAEAEHPVACPPQWLPVLLATASTSDIKSDTYIKGVDTTMSNAHARCLGQAKDMVSALGLARHRAASGFTSKMYFDATRTFVLKKDKQTFVSVHTPFERETCVLQKLQQFPWAPRLFCTGTDYILTSYSGQPACLERLPQDYMAQVATILSDLQSLGVRHNEVQKSHNDLHKTDFLMDERTGRLSLVDYGWASLNGSLAMNCTAHGGRVVSAKGTRPHNPVIDLGFERPETPSSVRMPRCVQKSDRTAAMSPDPAPATLPPSVLDGLAPMTLSHTRFKPYRNASRSRPQLQTRNWQESMHVSVLPAAPGAELHLLMFWNPSAAASAARYDQALQRFHGSIVGGAVHLAFGNATLSAAKLTEFYRANMPAGYRISKDPRGRQPFVILFLRLLSSSWTKCRGGISSRGQPLCPPTNAFKVHVRQAGGVTVHATDNAAEVESNLRTLGIHVDEASVGARRVRVGKTATAMHCTRDPACPHDPACFPRSLPQVMAAATKFAAVAAREDRVWSSVVELLHSLHDAGVAYLISRNWEHGLDELGLGPHPDVDLFVSDYTLTLSVIGGKRLHAPGRILVSKLVGRTVVSFDPRYVGDGYIDPAWATDAIRRRRPEGPGGTFVLAPVDHFFFLLYHAMIHKTAIAPDYNDRLQLMGQMLLEGRGAPKHEVPPDALLRKGSMREAPRPDRLALLRWYMSAHNYTFTRPTDPSVGFNLEPALMGESRRPCGVSELRV